MEDIKLMLRTKFQFNIGDFFTGMGSIFNLFGGYYDYDISEYSDAEALRSDAETVAEDMKRIINARE